MPGYSFFKSEGENYGNVKSIYTRDIRKYYLYLSEEEYRRVIENLVGFKNKLLQEGRYTDAVDDVIYKFAKAKRKKLKVVYK